MESLVSPKEKVNVTKLPSREQHNTIAIGSWLFSYCHIPFWQAREVCV